MSPERLCWLGAKSLAVRIMLKGNRDEKISWAENVENVQMFPAAGFTGYFSSFCVLPFFFSFLNKK